MNLNMKNNIKKKLAAFNDRIPQHKVTGKKPSRTPYRAGS
jgi:hypothetical protein